MIKIRKLKIKNEDKNSVQERRLEKFNRLLVFSGGAIAFGQNIVNFLGTEIIIQSLTYLGLGQSIYLYIGLTIASLLMYISLKPEKLVPSHYITLVIASIFLFAFRLPISAIIIFISGVVDVINKIW